MSADFEYPRQRQVRDRKPDALAPRDRSAAPARTLRNNTSDTPPTLLRPAWSRAAEPIAEPRKPTTSTSVVTMLTPTERTRVDAAGDGCYTAVHRDSLEEVLQDLRQCRADAVLVSVARCNAHAASSVARMVREFPAVPAVALWCDSKPDSAHAVLALGQYGVQSLVDAREPAGWRTLRQLFTTQRMGSIERRAVARVHDVLSDASEDCHRFLEACFTSPSRVGTIRQLAKRLGVRATTLMSRFYRAALPAPKRYLSMARLVRAAALFENPGLSITQVSNALEYSSPQSFGRHIHTMLGINAVAFRREFDGARMLDRFVEELLVPHVNTWRAFHPLIVLPSFSRSGDERIGVSSRGDALS